MKSPLFSIVIANYNYGRFLPEAINSVLSQCGPSVKCDDGVNRLPLPSGRLVELIVCDAKSTDNSIDVIQQYASSIAWWCSEKDNGQSDAFNKGFSHASGEFLTWLNADDLMLPGSLSAIEKLSLRHPKCKWLTGGMVECDKDLFVKRVFWGHRFSPFRAKSSRCITVGGPSSFFTKELLDSVGGVDTCLHYTMDIDLWMKFYFLQGEQYYSVGHPIWAFRYHEQSKMTGPTLTPNSDDSKRKRTAYRAEQKIRMSRFGMPNGLSRFIMRVPASFFDLLKVFLLSRKIIGRHLSAAFRGFKLRHRILLTNSMQEYITGLCALPADVFTVNTFYRKTFSEESGATIIPNEVVRDCKNLAEYITEKGIDIVYAQGFSSLLYYHKVLRKCYSHKPWIFVTCHTPTVWNTWWKAALYIIASSLLSDGIVFLAKKYQCKWSWLLGLCGSRKKNYHVPNPVDIGRFVDFVPRAKLLPSKRVTLGCIGVLSPRKNQELLIKVVAAMREKGYDVCARIGGDVSKYSAGYDDKLKEAARCFGVSDFVFFDGYIEYDSVPLWLKKIDIYVTATLAEVMPFSILEAMASGLPIVSHDIAGISEEVHDGVNGFLVKSLIVDDYVRSCEKILNRADFGIHSRQIATNEFSMPSFAKRMRHILEQMGVVDYVA